MGVSKVIYNTENGAEVLMDLTGDTVTPDKLARGATAHGANGELITGTATEVNIVQITGTSTTDVMSQAAVTNELDDLSKEIVDHKDDGTIHVTATEKQTWNGKVDKTSITLDKHTDGLIYIFVDGVKVGNGVEVTGEVVEGDVVGTIDENNNIILSGDLADGTYKLKYEYDEGDIREVGSVVISSIITYSITKTLSNCTASGATAINKGSTATVTIVANSGYELPDSITVSGASYTWNKSSGQIALSNPTGNVTITVKAVEAGPAYTNLADPTSAYWKEGYRLSISGGNTSACTGRTVTNFIPAKKGDVLRVKGMSMTKALNGQESKIVWYTTKDTESSKIGGMYGSTVLGSANTHYGQKVTVNGDVSTYTLALDNHGVDSITTTAKYIRIDGVLLDGYTKNDVIITINEEIV